MSSGSEARPAGLTWRQHQRAAFAAVQADQRRKRIDGVPLRSWVVMPPGSGKTYVGLGLAQLAREATGATVVVLVPTTAVQGQWIAAAADLGLEASAHRSVAAAVTVLTFQAVAHLVPPTEEPDPDPAVDPEGDPLELPEEIDGIADAEIGARLHENGSDLVARLTELSPLLVILDEAHHLLEAWGSLLVETLAHLGNASVVALTGTPRGGVGGEQRLALTTYFGSTAYQASTVDLVRKGDLAPYAELAWFTEPTAAEVTWMGEAPLRLAELLALLEAPGFGTTSLREWLRKRFVTPTRSWRRRVSWSSLAAADPAVADALLRHAHAREVELPGGARLRREHRRPPTIEDRMLLVDDWLRRCIAPSDDPRDAEVLAVLRRTLPAVGWVWTRHGVRRGREMADRVLARSEAKSVACVEILHHTLGVLGPRMRMLVLTDHESASSTVPMTVRGVVDGKAGSAWAVLDELTHDHATDLLHPVLVTGRTVAGTPAAMADLAAFVAERDPGLGATLRVVPVPLASAEAGRVPLARLVGERRPDGSLPWQAHRWIGEVTAFLTAGRTQVLVGTRSVLGEGWDARCVTGVVDLTTPTTHQSAVQVRGRSLRTDPTWPEKVAVNWTPVCVAEGHPSGAQDWERLVAKLEGYVAPHPAGGLDVGAGSLWWPQPFDGAAPPASRFAELNATAMRRAADLEGIRDAWATGEPTGVGRRRASEGALRGFVTHRTVELPPPGTVVEPRRPPERPSIHLSMRGESVSGVVSETIETLRAVALRRVDLRLYGEDVLDHARRGPGLQHVAGAVADGLLELGLTHVPADDAELAIGADGSYHAVLRGAGPWEQDVFSAALAEAIGPLEDARFLVSVPLLSPPSERGDPRSVRRAARRGEVTHDDEAWFAVPSVIGDDADRAATYAACWARWTGGRDVAVATTTPEGAGVLAAHA
ncbi:DEAD/DEAH box helicase family protein [Nocardioides zeae]|uniref:Superfamily II DNA or RNA helicase n=1 Tax=Nocardioides zeae TaxID=1457234 RepID=A0AAJ1X094_9ACTN|nr:DEAD/DEAH box helicase family protein [Nocardioides zeae]MDQ1103551.1 superfamily II DNA or RNA helicase [Nocardioides zeae]